MPLPGGPLVLVQADNENHQTIPSETSGCQYLFPMFSGFLKVRSAPQKPLKSYQPIGRLINTSILE